MKPTLKDLEDYFCNRKKRPSYKDAVDLYNALRTHFNGEFPGELISNRRPSEGDDIYEYRKRIYEPITQEACTPIITSLSKIKRSSDYSIKYDQASFPAQIKTGETLEDYCERNFPNQYTSVTNWTFAVLLKNLLIDPNAAVLIKPLRVDVPANTYLRPYPIVYNSDQVYEHIDGELAVLKSIEKTANKGTIFIVVTDEVIQRWEQSASKPTDYVLTDEYEHGLDSMPCFRLTGIFKQSYGVDYLDESRVNSIVPRLNEAAREYSDLQAEIVQHIFSERWEIQTQNCVDCNGTGSILATSSGKGKSGVGQKPVTCTKCNGTGTAGPAPYKKIVVRPANSALAESNTPIPPAGYVEKQIEIAKLQDDRVDKHIFKALSTINMQFLAQTPMNQSGHAKEVDKDELNNFIYSVAEDIIKIQDQVYYYVNEYRYKVVVPNETARLKMLPTIPVPEKYDILSSQYLLDDITSGKSASLNSITLMALEIDFVQKRFYDRPQDRDMLQLVFSLDPLPGLNEDEKLARMQGGGVLKADYVISCNILPFVRKALDENQDFFNLPREEQLVKMAEYAQPIIDEDSLAQAAQNALAVQQAQKAAGEPNTN
jgi:hypothetical protein